MHRTLLSGTLGLSMQYILKEGVKLLFRPPVVPLNLHCMLMLVDSKYTMNFAICCELSFENIIIFNNTGGLHDIMQDQSVGKLCQDFSRRKGR